MISEPPLDSMRLIPNNPSVLFQKPGPPELHEKPEGPGNRAEYLELLSRYEALLEFLKRSEKERIQANQSVLAEASQKNREKEDLEIAVLKLRERNAYIEETSETAIKRLKLEVKEKDRVIEENLRKVEVLAAESAVLGEANKKLEVSLKNANAGYGLLVKKVGLLEKENGELLEKTVVLEREKKRYWEKWRAFEEKARKDEGLRRRVKELECGLEEKAQEIQEIKEKFVKVSLDLRLARSSEEALKARLEGLRKGESFKENLDNNKSGVLERPEKNPQKSAEPSLERLMKENGELYQTLNKFSAALEKEKAQSSEVSSKFKEILTENEILRQKNEVLNLENEKLQVSNSQFLAVSKGEDAVEEKEGEFPQKNLEFIRESAEYKDLLGLIRENHSVRAKLDGLLLYIEENTPYRAELRRTKELYGRLLRKYLQIEKRTRESDRVLENSRSTATKSFSVIKEGSTLFNSQVSVAPPKKELTEESFLAPKRLFSGTQERRKGTQNKSFELDKGSCKKHRCGEKLKVERRINLTEFLKAGKKESYLLNFIRKKP